MAPFRHGIIYFGTWLSQKGCGCDLHGIKSLLTCMQSRFCTCSKSMAPFRYGIVYFGTWPSQKGCGCDLHGIKTLLTCTQIRFWRKSIIDSRPWLSHTPNDAYFFTSVEAYKKPIFGKKEQKAPCLLNRCQDLFYQKNWGFTCTLASLPNGVIICTEADVEQTARHYFTYWRCWCKTGA